MTITVTTGGPIVAGPARKTILNIIKEACPHIGLKQPTAVFASTTQEHIELAELANDCAHDLMECYEWEALITLATYTGDGSTIEYSLSSDFDRFPEDMSIWSSALETPLTHIVDLNQWLGLEVQSFDFVINAWIKFNEKIHIKPALASGVTAQYYYVSNLVVNPDAGTAATDFSDDSDTFLLSDRLLKHNIIWRWKKKKGLEYAEELATFEELKSRLIAKDKGSRTLTIGQPRFPKGLQVAYPQTISG